jgi:hypothetical protein
MATTATPGHIRVGGGQQGQIVDPSADTDPPVLTQPLINEPAQNNPPANSVLGPLAYLLGTWTNQDIGGSGSGGPYTPFSYNLMTLPQAVGADPNDPYESPYGYILKSMPYYEEITFTAIHGSAANRGGTGAQISNAILYEQRVYISDGPAKDMLVHFENGIWSFVTPMAQMLGPYGDGDGPNLGSQTFGTTPLPLANNIFKQISVPHGNSVLACGNATVDGNNNPMIQAGAPKIGAPPQVLPTGINVDIYTENTIQSPNSIYAQNPNRALTDALAVSDIKQFIQIQVDSGVGGGGVGNITYEQDRADVTAYTATYWIEDTGGGNFNQLQYTQTIMLEIPIPGLGPIFFPHITTNTLTKVSGGPAAGGAQ